MGNAGFISSTAVPALRVEGFWVRLRASGVRAKVSRFKVQDL